MVIATGAHLGYLRKAAHDATVPYGSEFEREITDELYRLYRFVRTDATGWAALTPAGRRVLAESDRDALVNGEGRCPWCAAQEEGTG